MKQYLISEADYEYLTNRTSGAALSRLRSLKPITRLTPERAVTIWSEIPFIDEEHGGIRFARAIERELLGGEQ